MQRIIAKLKELTGKEFVQLTERGNKSIDIVLDMAKQLGKTKILIPDQSGWFYYKKAPKKFGMDVIEVKTNSGLIDLKYLEEKADNNSVLISCSMPGYFEIDDAETIMGICNKKECIFVNDVSGSIGTKAAMIGNIVLGSFGKWKPINIEYGGFIATDNKEYYTMFDASYFDEKRYDELLKKIDELHPRLAKFKELRQKIISDLKGFDIINPALDGINVVVRFKDSEEKLKLIDYCKKNNLGYVECPNYIKVNDNAISIEVKRK